MYVSYKDKITTTLNQIVTQVSAEYPEKLILNFGKGILMASPHGRIALFKEEEGTSNFRHEDIEYYIVIDDTVNASLENLKNAHALVLFAKDGVMFQGSNDTRAVPYDQNLSFTIDHSRVEKLAALASEYIPVIPTLFASLFFVVFGIVNAIFLPLFLLILALIVKWLALIWKRKYDYVYTYTYLLYVSVLVLCIHMVIWVFVPLIPQLKYVLFPGFDTIILLIISYFGLIKNTPHEHHQPHHTPYPVS
jgi:uncharacterized membrane protein YhaH (DUF805 family)